ncbi:nucleotidyltransferase family protein [Pseudorhodoplanes sp.]|uniref:nucleotidyltransferase family protein n=1 Tax=Pseudorhodoplanes sp. TaxID=1934341 RepID=UPI003D099806
MSEWTRLLLPPGSTVRDAIAHIDAGGMQIALVADDHNRLLGTISDGDVRRCILRGIPLDAPAETIMNRAPTVVRPGEDRDVLLATMRARHLHRIPVLDSGGHIIGLETLDELVRPSERENVVVLMAGGLGTRLRPLTEERPKPMLMIGNRPILETIILNFLDCGFRRFFISVNYKAEMVKEHFGDGSAWGAEIRYLQESERMGTAGALHLLPEIPDHPMIVMNGDLLTKASFGSLIDFHNSHQAAATMCIREYDFQVPYGVVRTQDHRLIGVEEKPVQRFFVNAGIYVLSPDAVRLVPRGYYDMPMLFEQLVQMQRETAVFPIREYWLDIGHIADLEKAHGDFGVHFE